MHHKDKQLQFFATSPKGLELLLVDELASFGVKDAREKLAGVSFSTDLKTAYKACLWSRLANKILLRLSISDVTTPESLYQAAQLIDWSQHFATNNTFAVHAVCVQSDINHSMFAAQKIKDAIVDQFRDKDGQRPSVERDKPDVSVYVHLHRNVATFYIDLSGTSLHRRGYRLDTGAAPLKENLAAAILMRANWPTIAANGGMFMDPMCGSGTLLIEAAMMAADIAPGLARNYFGFLKWKQHDEKSWQALVNDALEREQKGLENMPDIVGYDNNADAIHIAFNNIDRADLTGKVHVEKRDVADFAPKKNSKPGLVVTNPPYGERLGEVDALRSLYRQLGDQLKQHFDGWQAAVFTGNPELGKEMGLHSSKQYALYNGEIACKLLRFVIKPENFIDLSESANNKRRISAAKRQLTDGLSDSVQMFINRLKKNLKHLRKKAKRDNLMQYRVYDADLPEYAFAIDVDGDDIKVSEYRAPKTVDEAKVLQRRHEVLSVLPETLEVPAERIYFEVIAKVK